jgi:hypothetical protein
MCGRAQGVLNGRCHVTRIQRRLLVHSIVHVWPKATLEYVRLHQSRTDALQKCTQKQLSELRSLVITVFYIRSAST